MAFCTRTCETMFNIAKLHFRCPSSLEFVPGCLRTLLAQQPHGSSQVWVPSGLHVGIPITGLLGPVGPNLGTGRGAYRSVGQSLGPYVGNLKEIRCMLATYSLGLYLGNIQVLWSMLDRACGCRLAAYRSYGQLSKCSFFRLQWTKFLSPSSDHALDANGKIAKAMLKHHNVLKTSPLAESDHRGDKELNLPLQLAEANPVQKLTSRMM